MSDAQEPARRPRGRGRPRDPDADAAILRAGLDLFIEGGVEGTSIERIAKRAGVGKLTVYRRWSSKDELLSAAVESAIADIPGVPREEPPPDAPVAELVEAMLPAAAEVIADERFRGLVSRIFGASTNHPDLLETYWQQYILPRRRAARVLLERARQQGVLPADTDAEALIDMMAGAVLYRVIQPVPLDKTEARRYLEAVYRQAGVLPAGSAGR